MFGWNLGSTFGNYNAWNNYQAYPTYNYNPWSSWTNSFSTSNPRTPFGGTQNLNLDRFDSSGVGNAQGSNQIFQQADYLKRLQILQALGAGAEQKIPNWRTMPFNDLLLAAARVKGTRPGNQTQTTTQSGQPLPLNVTARAYYDESQQLQQVQSINIWELNGNNESTYNSFGGNEVFARFNNAVKGRTYKIEVTWANGRRYQIEGINTTGNVVIDRPNR
jgi:hypothetical protein